MSEGTADALLGILPVAIAGGLAYKMTDMMMSRGHNPDFENSFMKEQKRRFSNVGGGRNYWLDGPRQSTEEEKVDGALLDVLAQFDHAPTTAEVRKKLGKTLTRRLAKFGGLKKSLNRMQDLGVIYYEGDLIYFD
jgi:hypothetical protein